MMQLSDRYEKLKNGLKGMLEFRKRHRVKLKRYLLITMHILGVVSSFDAVMNTRTSQGAIAWVVSLNTLPVVAVPAYWVFGSNDFDNYIEERRSHREKLRPLAQRLMREEGVSAVESQDQSPLANSLRSLSLLPITHSNKVELLVDGRNTYDSIFESILEAESYVLVQFYIIRDDDTGQRFRDLLIEKARQGVAVYLLYDDYGCIDIGEDYLAPLRSAGVRVSSFLDLVGPANGLQLNFRNHRKIVIVDGAVGFVGGLNVGDEYLGLHPELTPWRDSHVKVSGPVVTYLQIPFVEDWHWATGEWLETLDWNPVDKAIVNETSPEIDPQGVSAICVPSGPSDDVQTCNLFYQAAINAAEKRIWLSTPYFVPDESFIHALQLAALRGVEVKLIIPENSDSTLVNLSMQSYFAELHQLGIEIYRYQEGFLHQKVMLVDDHFCAYGSANLDNRSFRLNFEVMVGFFSKDFARKTEAMLTEDMANSQLAPEGQLLDRNLFYRFSVRVSRLLAPIQ
ncbi:cardiolipin synthase [Verrucomicrobiaceae bacterium R5-34]|nr:cardiolipin synthase [Verrucomicrobiaceae bacterium R5-34]